MLGNILVSPVAEVHVQQALVAAVERAFGGSERGDGSESLLRGCVHEDPGVEAVGPAYVGSGGQLFSLEQLVAVSDDLAEESAAQDSRYEISERKVCSRPIGRLTRASASRKTHFSYWVSLQQCSLVNVMPNSGLAKRAKFASSLESSTFTSITTEKTAANFSLRGRKVHV